MLRSLPASLAAGMRDLYMPAMLLQCLPLVRTSARLIQVLSSAFRYRHCCRFA